MRLAFVLVLATACDQVYGLGDRPEPGGIEAGLVAWYPMNSIADVLDDESGNNLFGLCDEMRCPTPTDGEVGDGLHFDGTMAVAVNASAQLETMDAFTIAGWYRITPSLGFKFQCPFNKVAEGGANTWQLCFSPSLQVYFFTTENQIEDDVLVGGDIDVDIYQHVVLWRDGTEKRIYVNGVKTASIEAGTVFTNGLVAIGADYDMNVVTAPFDGDLDDLRIYNRALGVDDIADLVFLGN